MATTELTVSYPGKAEIFVRDLRLLRPPARKRRNETQAPYNKSQTGPFTFKCYGADVTTSGDTNVICDGP